MSVAVIPELHRKYIRGTEKQAIVQLVQAFLCNLTAAVTAGISCPCTKVYINTRVIKHVYDKRPAQEFDFLVANCHTIVKYPDTIYRNKGNKRGSFAFVKMLKNEKYFCSIELIAKDETTQCEVATFFRTNDAYLKNFELLWEWKGGDLHRSAFDSGLPQPSSTLQ